MHALVVTDKLRYVTDYPIPNPASGEALVRVKVAGICNTDQELLAGYMNFQGIPGHEFVGVVEKAPNASHLEGQRVVGDINAACRKCPTCLAGMPTHCPYRTTLGIQGRDGAFAEYITLPVANLYAVPEEIPDNVAVFTEPLAAACEILEQVNIRPHDRVIIIGDGKLGLLCAQVLALTGCNLVLMGHHPDKMEIITRLGIPATHKVDSFFPGADIVVEATGNPSGYALACELVRPRGIIVLKSTYQGNTSVNLSQHVVNEITLVGSRCGPFAPALRLLAQKRINVTAMLTASYPLSESLAAFKHAEEPEALKILLTIPEMS